MLTYNYVWCIVGIVVRETKKGVLENEAKDIHF